MNRSGISTIEFRSQILPCSSIVLGNGPQKSGKQFSLGMYAELSVDGSKVVPDGARA